jgi:hypothetical protein
MYPRASLIKHCGTKTHKKMAVQIHAFFTSAIGGGKTGFDAHPVSCTMETGGGGPLWLGLKWPGFEADSLPPSCAKVKNIGTIAPLMCS